MWVTIRDILLLLHVVVAYLQSVVLERYMVGGGGDVPIVLSVRGERVMLCFKGLLDIWGSVLVEMFQYM